MYSPKALATPSYALMLAPGLTGPPLIAASVSCGYIGAYTLQSSEKREAWSIAICVSCGSISRFAFSVSCSLTVGYT